MKAAALFKIMAKEFKRDLLLSVLLLAFADFLYAAFTGIKFNRENGLVLWQGGNDLYPLNISAVLLKLSNLSIVFGAAGKMADRLSDNIMPYLLARVRYYRKFIYACSAAVLLLGESLLAASHLVYYCFAGIYPGQLPSVLFYFFLDALGFAGMMVLYLILNNCYALENSFACIIGIYLLNTVLPFPILPAISTAEFLSLKSRIPAAALILLITGVDLAAAFFYMVLIRRRRVNVC